MNTKFIFTIGAACVPNILAVRMKAAPNKNESTSFIQIQNCPVIGPDGIPTYVIKRDQKKKTETKASPASTSFAETKGKGGFSFLGKPIEILVDGPDGNPVWVKLGSGEKKKN